LLSGLGFEIATIAAQKFEIRGGLFLKLRVREGQHFGGFFHDIYLFIAAKYVVGPIE
jgi:hypothetical protein